MKSNNEGHRPRDSGIPQTPRYDDGRTPRQGDERTRTRRLADVRRGNKNRHHLELLASAQGGAKPHSSTPSSWASESRGMELWSAKAKRERIMPKPPDLETRHSCPALPAISSSLENYHDLNDSTKEGCKNRLSASQDLGTNSKTKQSNKQESFNPHLPKGEQFLARAKSLDFIANSRHPPLKGVSLLSKDKKQLSNWTPRTFESENKSKAVPKIQVNSKPTPETLKGAEENKNSSSTKQVRDEESGDTGPVVATRGRYSVLLNGGTLTTNAPYVDRIKGDATNRDTTVPKSGSIRQPDDTDSRQRKSATDNSSGRDRGRRAQKSSTAASRKLETVPSTSRRKGRHLRSHKELFAFQQDLLLPRYRKLAGINGNDGDETMKHENESERPSSGVKQGDGGNTRRSDAREVFEKVRLIIKGPDKVEPAPKPTEHKVRQMMPIYLKSGLPCGYVDSSSKCDAWLDSNDFDD